MSDLNKTDNVAESEVNAIVSGTELIACDEQGTPLIDDDGTTICNCLHPKISRFPENYMCLDCWGVWYR